MEALIKLLVYFESVAERWGFTFVIGGLIGGIIQRMRKRMSFQKFIMSLAMAMFVGWVIGNALETWLNLPQQIVHSGCALAGVFSEDILNEIEKFIKSVSELAQNIIKSKFGNKND